MAVDKLVDSAQLDGYFSNIASAIRSKAGVSSTYTPSEMPQAIQDIPSGGGGRSMQVCIAPNIITIGTNAFVDCRSLQEINLPKLGTVYNGAFASCYSLSTASFENCTQIQANAFSKCYNLLSLYLLGSQVASLVNTNAFSSTPISNYTTSTGGVYGSIFVPASLYDSYITKGNWSIYSNRFVSV